MRWQPSAAYPPTVARLLSLTACTTSATSLRLTSQLAPAPSLVIACLPLTLAPAHPPLAHCPRGRVPHPSSAVSTAAGGEQLPQLGQRLLRSLQPPTPTALVPDKITLPSPAPGATGVPAPDPQTDATDSTARTPARSTATLTVQPPPLPDKVKQRILRGEYIEFDPLLLEYLYPARYGASPTPAFTLHLSNDPAADAGNVVIAQQKPASRRTICDLASWMEAWNLYIHILVASFPERAPALRTYQAIICSASLRFPPRLWLRYVFALVPPPITRCAGT